MLDKTSSDILIRWLRVALNPEGDDKKLCQRFADSSQGLNAFDRAMAARFLKAKGIAFHQDRIKQYQRWCDTATVSPKLRVMVTLVELRFRIDKFSGAHPECHSYLQHST